MRSPWSCRGLKIRGRLVVMTQRIALLILPVLLLMGASTLADAEAQSPSDSGTELEPPAAPDANESRAELEATNSQEFLQIAESLTPDEGTARLELQDNALELSHTLSRLAPENYAGIVIDHASGRVQVGLVGRPSQLVLSAVTDVVGAKQTEIVDRQFTVTELNDIAAALADRRTASKTSTEGFGFEVNVAENSVDVYASSMRSTERQEIIDRFGPAIRLVSGDLTSVPEQACSRSACDPR